MKIASRTSEWGGQDGVNDAGEKGSSKGICRQVREKAQKKRERGIMREFTALKGYHRTFYFGKKGTFGSVLTILLM